MSKMLNKKFEDATVPDIENLIFEIDGLKNADSTKNKYRKVLKAFYRWMRGCAPREYPPEVKWICYNCCGRKLGTIDFLFMIDFVKNLGVFA